MKHKKQNIIILFCLFIIFSFITLSPKNSFFGINKKASNEIPGQSVEKDLIKIPIIIKVKDSVYKISVNKDSTLYEAMQDLQKTEDFTFKVKNFTGLGVFVEMINGLENKQSFYWMYSVNGKDGTVGVSKYVLKSGDFVKWEYRKSY